MTKVATIPARFATLSRTQDAVLSHRGILLVRHGSESWWLNATEVEKLVEALREQEEDQA